MTFYLTSLQNLSALRTHGEALFIVYILHYNLYLAQSLKFYQSDVFIFLNFLSIPSYQGVDEAYYGHYDSDAIQFFFF